MLWNYATVALRLFATQRLYAAINVLGLAIGLASCLVIALYLSHELSFDRFSDADRIYRISRDYFARGGARARVPAANNAPVAQALLEDFPEIEQVARMSAPGRMLFARGEDAFFETRFRWADASFFEIFDFEWVDGDAKSALAAPSSMVVTQSFAKKYFGADNPVGETIMLNNRTPLTVTGVIRDLPDNTHLTFDAVGSLSTMAPDMLQNWHGMTEFHTYFRLREGANVTTVVSRIPDFMNRRVAPDASSWSGMTITNVRDIHLRSTRDEEWKPSGNQSTIYTFTAVASLILMIALINFVNLATARASKRAKEVGVRKTLGATRGQLIAQFIGESVFTVMAAMLCAAAIVELVAPAFGTFLGFHMQLRYFGEEGIALYLIGAALLIGVIAGCYPAFYLSAFDPAKVLKGDVTAGLRGAAFRNSLVVLQFAIAIAILVGTVIVQQQTTFARELDLGFEKERVVLLAGTAAIGPQWPAFKEELRRNPEIVSVTASHYTPFSFDDNRFSVRPQGVAASLSRIQYIVVDYDFFETYEIALLAGRGFSESMTTDAFVIPNQEQPLTSASFVLNESAARMLGWSSPVAVDQRIEAGFSESFDVRVEGPVIGVVADTYFESVAVPLKPLVYVLFPKLVAPGAVMVNSGAIRVTGKNLPETLAHIDATWAKFRPQVPVTRRFLSEDFEAQYRDSVRQARMFTAFSLLAIVIACLGLFGLSSYTTERRTKEIGVRKVMGGTVFDIVSLFSMEFGKFVLIANLIAWPTAYFLAQRWLTNFVYRIDMSVWVFVASALVAFAVAIVTVGGVAARIAAANPIHSLRHE